MIKKDDTTLVKQCLQGNKKSFELLVDKYQKTIFNVAFRLCYDYDDAADITQVVFVKALPRNTMGKVLKDEVKNLLIDME